MRWTRSASMFLKVKRARSPDRVLIPLSGCLGTRSVGERGDEFGVGVELVHDAHVLDLGVVGAAHDLQEVVELT